MNQYLVSNKPEIFMFNETWLKKLIKDSELFPTNIYKVFRLDRSVKTHPFDLNNPSEFRNNGGGVLIGIKRDLKIVSTKL